MEDFFKRKVYRLDKLDGDYAHLVDQDGIENLVARAFLPIEADEGDTIIYEDLTYSMG